MLLLLFVGNGYGNTALHEACRAGNAATIQCLLQSGADVNAQNHKGSSPLHIYCYGDAEKRQAGNKLFSTVYVLQTHMMRPDGRLLKQYNDHLRVLSLHCHFALVDWVVRLVTLVLLCLSY